MALPIIASCDYDKRPGTGGNHGQQYEIKINCLMFLRGIRWGRFHLAANVNGAGAFDDIILQLHSDGSPSRTIFIQLKHKAKSDKVIPRSMLMSLSPKNEFGLLKYFFSFRDEIRSQFKTNRDHQVFGVPLDNCSFVLYTNANIQEQPEVSDYHDAILSSNSRGLIFSFLEGRDSDSDIVKFVRDIELYKQFLEQLCVLLELVDDVSSAVEMEVSKFISDYKMNMPFKKLKINVNILEMARKLKNSPSKQKLMEQLNILSSLGDLSEYNMFIKKLQICSQQASETDLDDSIKQELKEILGISLDYSTKLFNKLLKGIHDWWGGDSGAYLTQQSSLWKEIIVETLLLLNEVPLREMHVVGLRFKESETVQLRTNMEDAQVVLVLIESECTTLHTYKVVQTLEEGRCQFVLGLSADALAFWQSCWCPLLVAECHKMSSDILSTLKTIVNHHPEKKLVLIARKYDSFTDMVVKSFKTVGGCTEVSDDINLSSLDETTQEQVMKIHVIFQGHSISLRNLIGYQEELKKAVNSEMLFMLLKGNVIHLGAPVEAEITHYVPRTLQRLDFIHQDMIKEFLRVDGRVIAVSGITEEELKQLIPSNERVHTFHGQYKMGCRFYIVDKNADITSLQEEAGCFVCLSKENSNFRITCLKGNIDIKCIVDPNNKSRIQPNHVWDVLENVTVIAGEPGMGKSTLLTHIIQNTKAERPEVWVVRVDLNNMTSCLRNAKLKIVTEQSVIHFIATAAGVRKSFETLLFKYCVNTIGRLVVLFDGFDEICPDYKEQVLAILYVLCQRNVFKVWITSRYSWKRRLEQSFFCIAFVIEDFSVAEQRSFLFKVWTERIPDVDKCYLDTFITDVLELVSKSLQDTDRSFMGIPLQTMLVAEVFEEYLGKEQEVRIIPKYLDIVQFYEDFIHKKCQIYFLKRRDDINNSYAIREMKKKEMDINDKHIYVALSMFLSQEKLKTLHNKSISRSATNYLHDDSHEWSIIGIINSVVDGKAQFLHRTIMEFFVAKWFRNNYHYNMKFVKDNFFTDDYSVVRRLFDVMMTQGCPLHIAALNNDLPTLKQILNSRNVNSTDQGRRTPLHITLAARKYPNTINIVQLLIENGANIYITDKVLEMSAVQYGDYTENWEALGIMLQGKQKIAVLEHIKKHTKQALLVVCQNDYLELLQCMIFEGVNVNVKLVDYKGRALHVATENGHMRIIDCLLKAGADVNAVGTYGKTALHMASLLGDVCIVERLLKAGANANAVDWTESTPLHYSSRNGYVSVVESLLQAGAKTSVQDQFGSTPHKLATVNDHRDILRCFMFTYKSNIMSGTALHREVMRGNSNIVKHLLQSSSNVNFQDSKKQIPLHIAVLTENHNMVKLLLENGSMVNALDENNYTSLDLAIFIGHLATVQILVENSSTLDAFNKNKMTPLHYAAKTNYLNIVEYLVEIGGNLHARCSSNRTPLYYAVDNGHLNTVQYLVEKGCTVNTLDGWNLTPLHYAIRTGHIGIIQFLVEHGAAVNGDDGYDSPLHHAANKGQLNVVEFLIKNGSTVDALDINNKTPLHYAIYKGHSCVINFLIDKDSKLEKNKMLHYAVKLNREDIVKLLIDKGCRTNTMDGNNCTPLHYAAQMGNLSIVDLLVENGSEVDAVNRNNKTALHLSSEAGHLMIVEALLKMGSTVNSVDKDSMVPLHYAAWNGHLDVVHILIDSDCNLHARQLNKWTPLHCAAIKGHTKVVEVLIEKGSAVNAIDLADRIPVHHAASEGHLDIVCLLIDKGSTVDAPDKSGMTPFHYAVRGGHIAIINFLIGNSPSFSALEKNSSTSLKYACVQGYINIIELLIEKGTSVNAVDEDNRTPLHHAVMESPLAIVSLLINKGSDINALDKVNMTPLHYAIIYRHFGIVQHLVRSGSTVVAQDKTGMAPLHYAAIHNYTDTAKLLISIGSTVNIVNDLNMTPLHYASRHGNIDVVTLLLKVKCHINHPDEYHKTPLHYAVEQGHLNIALLLIEEGSTVDALDKDGMTPLHYAAAQNRLNVAWLLIEKGSKVDDIGEENMTRLHYAVKHENVFVILLLITRGTEIDACDSTKKTPLHYAAIAGHLYIANLLIKKGCMVDVLDKENMTALHYAAQEGHLEIVQLLISKGYVDVPDKGNITPLHCAVRRGHLGVVQLLAKHFNVMDIFDNDHKNLLHYAVLGGNIDIVKLLIDRGIGVNSFDKYNMTALHYTAQEGHNEIAQLLIKEGSLINTLNIDHMTPLHSAAQLGHQFIVSLLIEKGCYLVNSDKDCRTPLHLAAMEGHLDIVNLLIENYINVDIHEKGAPSKENGDVNWVIIEESSLNTVDEKGMTPLDYAACQGHIEVVKVLFETCKKLESFGSDYTTCLHFAARAGHVNIVQFLIENRYPVDVLDKKTATPLHYASSHGHLEVVKILIEKGSSVNVIDRYGSTPLHFAIYGGHIDVVHFLLENDCNMNVLDNNFVTPVHVAARQGHVDILQLLIEMGGLVNTVDKDGMTLLHCACKEGHTEVVKLLAKDYIVWDAINKDKMTALHFAAALGELDIVQLLIEKGSNVNSSNEYGATPLHYAVLHGHEAVAIFLIECGSAVNALDNDNMTPLHYAARVGSRDIVRLLVNRGSRVEAINVENQTARDIAVKYNHEDVATFLYNQEPWCNVM